MSRVGARRAPSAGAPKRSAPSFVIPSPSPSASTQQQQLPHHPPSQQQLRHPHADPSTAPSSVVDTALLNTLTSPSKTFQVDLLTHPALHYIQQTHHHQHSPPPTHPHHLHSRLALSVRCQLYALLPTSPTASSLLSLDIKQVKLQRDRSWCELLCTPPLPAATHSLLLSNTATYLAVLSDHGVTVVKLPRHTSPAPTNTSQPHPPLQQRSVLKCRAYSVGEYYHGVSVSLTVRHVAWHPLSDHHLLVLTSDDTLRLYNLVNDIDVPEQIIVLTPYIHAVVGGGGGGGHANHAVSFCCGSVVGWEMFAVYVLLRNGQLCLICPLVPYQCLVEQSVIQMMMESEEEAIARYTAGDDEDEEDRESDGLQVEQAQARLSWLQRAFTTPTDAKQEPPEDHQPKLLSQKCDLEAMVQIPVDIGAAASAASSSSSSSRATASPATFLVCLRHTAPPTRLIRVFASGRVDVIVGVNPIQPAFLTAAYPPSISSLASCLLPVDTVMLPPSLTPLPSPLSASSLVVLSSRAVHLLTFPYLDQLTAVLMTASDSVNEEVANVVEDAETGMALIEENARQPWVDGCVIDEVLIGRWVLLMDEMGEFRMSEVRKHTGIIKRLIQSAAGNDVNSPQRRQQASGPQGPGAKHAFNITPFSMMISQYVKKYSQFRVATYVASRLSPHAPLSLSSPASFQQFIGINEVFSSTTREMTALQSAMNDRLSVLSSRILPEQERLRGAVGVDLAELRKDHQRLTDRLQLHQEIAAALSTRGIALVAQLQATQQLSDAERGFQLELQRKKAGVSLFKKQVTELNAKIAQLNALMTSLQGQSRQSRAGDTRIGRYREGEGIPAVPQLASVQKTLKEQTKEIESLMATLKELKQQLQPTQRDQRHADTPLQLEMAADG